MNDYYELTELTDDDVDGYGNTVSGQILKIIYENEEMMVMIFEESSGDVFKVVHWGFNKDGIHESLFYDVDGTWMFDDERGWQFESSAFQEKG